MSRKRQCYLCDATFWPRPDTISVPCAYPNGSAWRNGRASFCPPCTARLNAAMDDAEFAKAHRTPLHHPGGRSEVF